MGGILLYVIGIIFHWLYCKCLFYRNILLSKCSDPSSHTLPALVLLCYCLSLSAWCIGAEKTQTQVKCQPTSDGSPEPLIEGQGARHGRAQRRRHPLPIQPLGSLSKLWAFLFMVTLKSYVFFKRRVLKSQKAIFGSCERPRICLNVLEP